MQSVAVAAVCADCVCVSEGCRLHVKYKQLAVFTLGKLNFTNIVQHLMHLLCRV